MIKYYNKYVDKKYKINFDISFPETKLIECFKKKFIRLLLFCL